MDGLNNRPTREDEAAEPLRNYKKVFIQRDYTEGMAVRYSTKFPPELEGRLSQQQYEGIIGDINNIFQEAESLSPRVFCESCFACLSAYLLYLCIDTHYEKCLKQVAHYIEDQNRRLLAPRGLVMIDPAERGLRIIEVWIVTTP